MNTDDIKNKMNKIGDFSGPHVISRMEKLLLHGGCTEQTKVKSNF